MFERFDPPARKIMGLARQEVKRLGHEFIDTEHILLAILMEYGPAARVLISLPVGVKRFRQEVETLRGPSKPPGLFGLVPFSPWAKRAIENAASIADERKDPSITSSHLLAGLCDVREGLAAQCLTNLGFNTDEIRRLAVKSLDTETP